MNWPVFFKRTGSAVIYVAVMLGGLMWEHPWAVLVLAALLQFLSIKEFFKISDLIFPNPNSNKISFWLAVVVSAFLIVAMVLKDALIYQLLVLVPITLFLWTALSKKNILSQTLTCLLAILYIGLPLAMMVDLRNYAMILPVGILVLIWVNDTMAYIVGSFIGKTPFTSISPKKTIEGTVGGIVFTMLIAWLFGTYLQDFLAAIHWMIIGGIVAITGTLGDLVESQMKRKAGIKDSGNILPGHGGALDRLDSILAVMPFVYVYFHWFAFPLIQG